MSGILSIAPLVTDQQGDTASLLGIAGVSRTRARSPGAKNIDAEDEAASAATMWDFRAQGEATGQPDDHRHRSRGHYVALDENEDGDGQKHDIDTYA